MEEEAFPDVAVVSTAADTQIWACSSTPEVVQTSGGKMIVFHPEVV